MARNYPRLEAIADVLEELNRATKIHGPWPTAHHGYAVILEELDELWAEIKRKETERNNKAMRTEAIHVAATALRFIIEICDKEETNHG